MDDQFGVETILFTPKRAMLRCSCRLWQHQHGKDANPPAVILHRIEDMLRAATGAALRDSRMDRVEYERFGCGLARIWKILFRAPASAQDPVMHRNDS
jgi:hypothetical protein